MSKRVGAHKKFNLLDIPTAGMISIVLVFLCITIALLKPEFVSQYNLSTLSRTISFTTIVAFGQTLVLLTGGIDLSVAGVSGLAGISAAWLMVNTAIPWWLVVIIVIGMSFVCGVVNGLLITKMKMVPFVVTLATGSIFTGFIYVITKGSPIMGIPLEATKLGQGMLFGIIPYPAIAMFLLGAIGFYILKFTPFGRYIYAVGGNENAAHIAGIKVNKVTTLVYALSGMMAGVAGILMTLRLGTAQPTVGADWVMPSVTAACIGGTSLSGGRGGVVGAIVGGIFMGVIQNAIVILQISAYWEKVIIGIVIIIAIAIDRLKVVRSKDA
jgi:ribose transport system permease protein